MAKIKKTTQQTNSKTKPEEKGLNDLLLPILLCLVLLPFTVFLKVYSTGLSKYDFYPDVDISYDFYAYYRSRIFLIIMAFAAIILVGYLLLYKSERKSLKPFIPLGIFAVLTILSSIFSVDSHIALWGNVNACQGIFVIMSYMVLLLYVYQLTRSENDYKQIYLAMGVLALLSIVIGIMQMTGNDPLNFTWIQKLCMNAQDETRYLGNIGSTFSSYYVFLTLFNPNYASIFLAMGIVFLTGMLLSSRGTSTIEKIILSICLVCFVVLLYFTFSRMGLIATLVGILFLLILMRLPVKTWAKLGGILLAVILLFTVIDATRDFRFFKRFLDEKPTAQLSEIVTDTDGVHITYEGKTLDYQLDKASENQLITVELEDTTWQFGYENGSYYYLNPFGKHQILEPVERIKLNGLESFASGRGYFWSRLLPRLKQHLLLGSGPDSTMLLFPQDDYAGRLTYSKDLTMICDRAHNGYLQIALETGLVGLILLLIFACNIILTLWKEFTSDMALIPANLPQTGYPLSLRMGRSCLGAFFVFLFSLLTNDVNIFIMPFACICLGLAMSSAALHKK